MGEILFIFNPIPEELQYYLIPTETVNKELLNALKCVNGLCVNSDNTNHVEKELDVIYKAFGNDWGYENNGESYFNFLKDCRKFPKDLKNLNVTEVISLEFVL